MMAILIKKNSRMGGRGKAVRIMDGCTGKGPDYVEPKHIKFYIEELIYPQ
jgi:hypothetical protein